MGLPSRLKENAAANPPGPRVRPSFDRRMTVPFFLASRKEGGGEAPGERLRTEEGGSPQSGSRLPA